MGRVGFGSVWVLCVGDDGFVLSRLKRMDVGSKAFIQLHYLITRTIS